MDDFYLSNLIMFINGLDEGSEFVIQYKIVLIRDLVAVKQWRIQVLRLRGPTFLGIRIVHSPPPP